MLAGGKANGNVATNLCTSDGFDATSGDSGNQLSRRPRSQRATALKERPWEDTTRFATAKHDVKSVVHPRLAKKHHHFLPRKTANQSPSHHGPGRGGGGDRKKRKRGETEWGSRWWPNLLALVPDKEDPCCRIIVRVVDVALDEDTCRVTDPAAAEDVFTAATTRRKAPSIYPVRSVKLLSGYRPAPGEPPIPLLLGEQNYAVGRDVRNRNNPSSSSTTSSSTSNGGGDTGRCLRVGSKVIALWFLEKENDKGRRLSAKGSKNNAVVAKK
eukprot:jgi/Bigna1/68127/fgenesh1_pg.5_\